MSTNSSERTVAAGATTPSATAQNPLAGAHHHVSIKLTYRNFLFWRTQLVQFLHGQELLGFVDGDTPCPPSAIEATPASDESNSAATTGVPVPNPAYKAWIKQDQSILSFIISSLSDEVMHLAVGKATSREVWESIMAALGSTTRARCLSFLGQFHSLRQGNGSAVKYLGRAQLLVEQLALVGRPISLDEQNLFVFRGLRPEYLSLALSLTAAGIPVTISQISDYLQAHEFIHAEDYPAGSDGGFTAAPSAMYVGRGGRNNGGRSTRDGGRHGQNRGRGGRGGQNRGRSGRNSALRCQICRAQGHTVVYCFKRYTTQPPAQVNMVTAGDESAPPSSASGWLPVMNLLLRPRLRAGFPT
ncbi:PREDICTED: uncharacterized protein LOC109163796 [Ipomoea nil]|uniref:uncharacterized protein LOC109163796 n=1 Tax=Ipomoea nil TaxID=35883 RepID=UPI000900C2D6|nr:PREDICTED: uncharacterized protein LOC109163796 [Ipomoea nil]